MDLRGAGEKGTDLFSGDGRGANSKTRVQEGGQVHFPNPPVRVREVNLTHFRLDPLPVIEGKGKMNARTTLVSLSSAMMPASVILGVYCIVLEISVVAPLLIMAAALVTLWTAFRLLARRKGRHVTSTLVAIFWACAALGGTLLCIMFASPYWSADGRFNGAPIVGVIYYPASYFLAYRMIFEFTFRIDHDESQMLGPE